MRAVTILLLLAAILGPAPALAETAAEASADAWDCANADMSGYAIAACTRVIATWGATNPGIAWAFYHRANGFAAQHDFGRAILDYDAAVALKPTFAQAYGGRGLAYFARGDYARAVQDYDLSIRYDPLFATTYQDRCY